MLNQPFFQVTLPLMVTFVVSIWLARGEDTIRNLKHARRLRAPQLVPLNPRRG